MLAGMKALSASYGDWFILAVPVGQKWAISCLPPRSNTICTDWKAYKTPEAALAGAQDYIDRAAAIYALADAVLELHESGKIDDNSCQGLLRSLGYCQ